MRLGAMLVALCWATTALAQEEPKDAKTAVELARAAFEFRDFQKVVDTLRPWVRPMRILEPELKIEARSLTGVSLHLLGRIDEAKEEFGELLLLEPKHQLDPFVVPPEVIATFEAMRRELKPTLDRILRERGESPAPEPPLQLKLVTVPHPAIAFLPFGTPQFLLEQPGWGAAYAIVQILGLGVNIGAWIASGDAAERPVHETWKAIQYTGLAVAVLAYAGSVIHGIYLLDTLQLQGGSEASEVQPTP